MRRRFSLCKQKFRNFHGQICWYVLDDGEFHGAGVREEPKCVFTTNAGGRFVLYQGNDGVKRFPSLKKCRDWLNQSELERIVAAIQ